MFHPDLSIGHLAQEWDLNSDPKHEDDDKDRDATQDGQEETRLLTARAWRLHHGCKEVLLGQNILKPFILLRLRGWKETFWYDISKSDCAHPRHAILPGAKLTGEDPSFTWGQFSEDPQISLVWGSFFFTVDSWGSEFELSGSMGPNLIYELAA